jgi:ribosomal protein L11 methyltransferase
MIVQQRHFFRGSKADTQAVYDALELPLEDDGVPLALSEIDEDRDRFEVSVYLYAGDAVNAQRINELAGASVAQAKFIVEDLPEVDWVTRSLEGLKPVRAGRFLVYGAHDRDKLLPGDIGIEIEAGQAFGTGHHGTTAGCLQRVGEIVSAEQPRNALDLGTGSAVLAIAIVKLAPIPVLATDIDPVAVDVAAGNVRLNGVDKNVTLAVAADFDHPAFAAAGPFDLIVANILANPLISLAHAMETQLSPSGSVILSGILQSQHDAVVTAYAKTGLRHISTLPLEGWVTIHLKR